MWNSYKSLARARWTLTARKAALWHTASENHPGIQPSSPQMAQTIFPQLWNSENTIVRTHLCLVSSSTQFSTLPTSRCAHWKPPSQTQGIAVINTLASCHKGSGFEIVPKRILRSEKVKCSSPCVASSGYLLAIKNTYYWWKSFYTRSPDLQHTRSWTCQTPSSRKH